MNKKCSEKNTNQFHPFKGILSILHNNLDYEDFVYICMKLKDGGF